MRFVRYGPRAVTTAPCFFGFSVLLALASCAAAPPVNSDVGSCPIAGSANWAASINALNRPTPTLIVTGSVTVPTGGYRPSLVLAQVAESYPVQVFIRLELNPPAGMATQAIVTHEVRGEWPMSSPVGSVTVRCRGHLLAHVSPVPSAR